MVMLNVQKIKVGKLRTNCYLVSSGDEMIVIDPGAEADLILGEIKKTEKKLKYIVNTHFHFDHVTDNDKIQEKTKAKILISENEKDFIDFKVDKFLKEGDKIKIGEDSLSVINTPGHSKGSICLLGEEVIFTGDTLFRDCFGRTDLDGGSEDEMEESLEKLSKIITPDVIVYPGHGDSFDLID